jgi:hypothetical protein
MLIRVLLLTAIQNGVDGLNVRSLVDGLSFDFDPSMGLEWQFLRTENHLRWNAMLSEEVSCDEGALEA